MFRRQMCPVTSGPVDNCVRVVWRPQAHVNIIGSGVPIPESAIFGYRRVPRHVPQYPWYRMRALDFALATTPFRGKKFRARRSCSGW